MKISDKDIEEFFRQMAGDHAQNANAMLGALIVRKSAIESAIENAKKMAGDAIEVSRILKENALLPIDDLETSTRIEKTFIRNFANIVWCNYCSRPIFCISDDRNLEVCSIGTYCARSHIVDLSDYLKSLEGDQFEDLKHKPFGNLDDLVEFVIDRVDGGYYDQKKARSLILCAVYGYEQFEKIPRIECDSDNQSDEVERANVNEGKSADADMAE